MAITTTINMYKQVKIRKSLLFILSAIPATAVATVVTGIGLKHNTQLEFNDPITGAIDYQYVSLIFLSWFIPAFLFFSILIWLFLFIKKRLIN